MNSLKLLLMLVTIIVNMVLGNHMGTILSMAATLFLFLFENTEEEREEIIYPKSSTPPFTDTFKQRSKIENFNSLLEKVEGLEPVKAVVNPKYKGAVDFEGDVEDYKYKKNLTTQYGEDKIAALQLKHRGANAERQLAGSYNKMKVMKPMLAEELHNEEYSVWWGNNDK